MNTDVGGLAGNEVAAVRGDRGGLRAAFPALVTLLSAFLLFQVQPLISKAILPWFGGSPAVWTTAMLFFQLVLLAGYAYAHLVERLRSRGWQLAIHIALLAAAIVTLPITPREAWKPTGAISPAWHILGLLLVSVGLPYFLLSSTGPLVQAWFTRIYPGRSPYRLYSLSNIGSLAALLTYPFLVEPALTTTTQGQVWSLGFLVFAFGSAGLAWWAAQTAAMGNEVAAQLEHTPSILGRSRLRTIVWMALPALAVVVLLSVTNRLCRDVAVVPFLWIVPLTLYLLSFIIAFDHQRWYRRGPLALTTAILTLLVAATTAAVSLGNWFDEQQLPLNPAPWLKNVYVESGLSLGWLFCTCMVCHGELYRARPAARHLTAYYLSIAAGGAVGGLLVAIVCPLIFSDYWEWHTSLLLAYGLSAAVAGYVAYSEWSGRTRSVAVSSVLFSLGGLILILATIADALNQNVVLQKRNFYGVLTIREYIPTEEPKQPGYALVNGRILHGFQYHEPALRRTATTYYGNQSGPGIIVKALRERQEHLRFGVVGLGTGSMAAYGMPGDSMCFYEIDPNVVALQGKYFTYLDDCPADIQLELGDARLALENQPPQRFDFLLMDAFSGDAIPAHLVTREALEVYRRHMRPGGLIVFHISNRYLNLLPVIRALAADANMTILRFYRGSGKGFTDFASDYVALTDDTSFFERVSQHAVPLDPFKGQRILWTDQFSNLWEVLR